MKEKVEGKKEQKTECWKKIKLEDNQWNKPRLSVALCLSHFTLFPPDVTLGWSMETQIEKNWKRGEKKHWEKEEEEREEEEEEEDGNRWMK